MSKLRIFVSHSHADNLFTARLVGDLNVAGAETWADLNDLRHGDFLVRINEALGRCEWFVLVLTQEALKSAAVQMEMNAAQNLLLQSRIRGIIPVLADKCNARDIPPTWSTLHYFDATIDYELALDGILAALDLRQSHLMLSEKKQDRRSGGLFGRMFGRSQQSTEFARLRVFYLERMREDELTRPLPAGTATVYPLPSDPTRSIRLLQGDLRAVLQLEGEQKVSVNAIVNPVDDYLQVDRVYSQTVSGELRYLDAHVDDNGLTLEDSFVKSLFDALPNGIGLPISKGSVLVATTTRLNVFDVSCVLHVVTSRGVPEGGFAVDTAWIESGIRNCFDVLQQHHLYERVNSILIPITALGDGRLSPTEVAQSTMRAVLTGMQTFSDVINSYVLAYRGVELEALRNAATDVGL